MTDKLLKARLIIGKLLANMIFTDWENRSRDDVIAMLHKYNEELELGINPSSVIQTMIDHDIIHTGPYYEGNQYYSLCSKQSENSDQNTSKSYPSNTTTINSSTLHTQTNLL